MASAAPTWRLADLVDYESFLEGDEGESAETLRQRDRAIFAQSIESQASNSRDTLRLWLEERRRIAHNAKTRREIILPGEAFAQTRGFLVGALGVIGALLGGGAAWSALAYTRGGEPINALAFFCEFALLQIIILLVALGALGLRKFLPELPSLARLLWRLAAGWASRLWQRSGARVTTGGTRADARAALGALRARRGLYGSIVGWNLLRLTQIFAVAFNLGVLGATTARLSLQQLYFGWEATFPTVNATNVHRLVSVAALPWSGLDATPSREAVERSQNFRRNGEQPDPASSPVWGAFLLAAVTCYGLLPRAALFGWAWFAERRALGQLRFHDARSEALLQRLQTPRMTVASVPSTAVAARPPVAARAEDGIELTQQPAATTTHDPRRLVLNLTGLPLSVADVTPAVTTSAPVADVLIAGTLDPAADDRAFAAAAEQLLADPELRPVALLGAWTPPMRATHLLLDRLRNAAGTERLLELALVGKPTGPASPAKFRPVESKDRELWQRAVRARGDAFLTLSAR